MPVSPQVVEAVVDSSRYFAIRIVDRLSNRHAIIGIGFRCVISISANDYVLQLHSPNIFEVVIVAHLQ